MGGDASAASGYTATMATAMCATCGSEIDPTSTKTLWMWEGSAPPDNSEAARPYCGAECARDALQRT